MKLSLIPIFLAGLGFTFIVISKTMLLFDWEIQANANLPSTYNVYIPPSPWGTKLGESLDDRSYIFQKISISDGQNTCINIESFGLNVARSSQDRFIESISLSSNKSQELLILGSLMEIALSGIYIWWFTLSFERGSISDAFFSTVVAGVFLIFLVYFLATILGPLIARDIFLWSKNCQGSLTFDARLLKIHYETLIIMFIGILAELGAFGVMLHQIIISRKTSSEVPG